MTQVFKDNSGKLSERHLSMLRLPLQLEWYNTQMHTVHVKEKKEKKHNYTVSQKIRHCTPVCNFAKC